MTCWLHLLSQVLFSTISLNQSIATLLFRRQIPEHEWIIIFPHVFLGLTEKGQCLISMMQ